MFHLHVVQQLPPITLSSWTGELSPNDKYADAKYNPNIIFDIKLTNRIFPEKIWSVIQLYISHFLLFQEKFFLTAKTIYTFHLNCKETKSHTDTCNQTKVLLQKDFKLKVLTKYFIEA